MCRAGGVLWCVCRAGGNYVPRRRFNCVVCVPQQVCIYGPPYHTFKWEPLADEVLEAASNSPTEKTLNAAAKLHA